MSLTIWIDADACPKPVKEVVFKNSFRLKVPVILVANSYMSIPLDPLIRFIQVDKGADVADQYIVDNCSPGDLVITADIPLADFVVKKEAIAINPRGEEYTEDNISERLSMRNFMQDLRDSGMDTGGPAPYGPKDKEMFTNALNRLLTKLLK
ncbi:YaiI/YqxD family protein [Halobacteriovorax sp. HLS]|uniref:YaiI/YqxD family protein n=1 Tax=Halobacteriovorax sp. HLS TaxID=2234000 RepID=UPI000FD7CD6B|nr:YaiI/YqxD family protein [Halobacteriovorax sp. HLS]